MDTEFRRRQVGIRIDELEYASAMLRELQQMMQANGEKTIAYLIEMAYLDACERRRQLHERSQQSANVTAAA